MALHVVILCRPKHRLIRAARLHLTSEKRVQRAVGDLPSGHLTAWWFFAYPSEKYESQLGLLFPIYGKIKNVPNHRPVNIADIAIENCHL